MKRHALASGVSPASPGYWACRTVTPHPHPSPRDARLARADTMKV
ncbi:hypothetical protein WG922_08760 [Ramlibacter sp. AN1015]